MSSSESASGRWWSVGFGGIVAGWSREAVVTQGTCWMYLGVGDSGRGRGASGCGAGAKLSSCASTLEVELGHACGTDQRVEKVGRGAVL